MGLFDTLGDAGSSVVDYGKGRVDLFTKLPQIMTRLTNLGLNVATGLLDNPILLYILLAIGGYVGYRIFLAK